MEITQSLPKSVNFKFNVKPSLTGVTTKFSTREGIIFKASLNFNRQILSLQELGGAGEAKHPKLKIVFSRNYLITVKNLLNYQNTHLTVDP